MIAHGVLQYARRAREAPHRTHIAHAGPVMAQNTKLKFARCTFFGSYSDSKQAAFLQRRRFGPLRLLPLGAQRLLQCHVRHLADVLAPHVGHGRYAVLILLESLPWTRALPCEPRARACQGRESARVHHALSRGKILEARVEG